MRDQWSRGTSALAYSLLLKHPVISVNLSFVTSHALPEGHLCTCKRPGASFSKVPKLYGPFSGVTIPFVSQERRGFKSSNFTVIFLFVTLKTCQKIGFPEQAVSSFTNGFSGPKCYRDFRETGHWGLFLESTENFSGPKSQSSNCNPLILKSWSFNMFLM